VQRDNVDELDGLGKQMPVTLGAFMIGASGLAGIPLLAGFIGKWQIGVGAVEAGYPVFVVVLVVSGLFNIAYFFPIISDAFLKSSPVVGTDARPIITAPLVFSAGIAIMLGLFPDAGFHFYSLARLAASTIVMGPNGGGLP
jgi:formate hydrogenlyase subunit 3/multisubunit Na+/H+ antiporter MnhD subunit